MKKVSLFFGNRLKCTIANDREFRSLPVLSHALSMVTYIVCSAATGKPETPLCPILCERNMGLLPLNAEAADGLSLAYRGANRIEAVIETGSLEVCLSVIVRFQPPGRMKKPLIVLHGGVDSDGWRVLKRMM